MLAEALHDPMIIEDGREGRRAGRTEDEERGEINQYEKTAL
jgi:hypothetical protein